MKLRLLIPITAIIVVLLASCTATNPYTKSKLNGSWVKERVNDQHIATDDRVTMIIDDKDKATIGEPDNRNEWKECNLKWKFEGDTFTLTGTDVNGVSVNQQYTVKLVNDTMIILSHDITPEGAKERVSESIQYRRVLTNKSQLTGTWQVIDGNTDSINTVRYSLGADGKYDYYILNGENWEKKAEMSGIWFAYGHFIVMNTPTESSIKAQIWDTSIATVGSDKIWLQTNSDKERAVLKTRTLKYIK